MMHRATRLRQAAPNKLTKPFGNELHSPATLDTLTRWPRRLDLTVEVRHDRLLCGLGTGAVEHEVSWVCPRPNAYGTLMRGTFSSLCSSISGS